MKSVTKSLMLSLVAILSLGLGAEAFAKKVEMKVSGIACHGCKGKIDKKVSGCAAGDKVADVKLIGDGKIKTIEVELKAGQNLSKEELESLKNAVQDAGHYKVQSTEVVDS